MIKELINFTDSLDEDFKTLGSSPKEGLHILLKTVFDDSGQMKIDTANIKYELFSKKQKEETSEFLNCCKKLQQNAWCINTNKCFDLPIKAIHTCSPYAVAFKREHLHGGTKYNANDGEKKQIYERFDTYFSKAFELFENKEDAERYKMFEDFFAHNTFSSVLENVESDFSKKRDDFKSKTSNLKVQLKESSDKVKKQELKDQIKGVEQKLLKVKELEDSDYVVFYLDLKPELYIKAHEQYLKDKLFTVDKYNTEPDENGVIYGSSNFLNGLNGDMPFLMHQTASFDISGRISNKDAKLLYDLQNVFSNKTLPNPLPLFIYKEEIQNKIIGIFKDSGFKYAYKEIIENLLENHTEDLSNYYLLFWQNTKKGLAVKDFDFVSKFEYKISDLAILNLFDLKEKGGKESKHYPTLRNIFEFEQMVFKPFVQNKYHRIDYFGDLKTDDYGNLDMTYTTYCKYRKAIYDYVYKSKKQTIEGHNFNEMVFNGIKDDLKNGNAYGVKDKLNIWYSLYNYFNKDNSINMVNKLKEYQDFVAAIIADEQLTDLTDEKFAFAAGQVVDYLYSKSKSADTSYNFLEPYLQQVKCEGFKKAIANDFARYKHENFSKNYRKVAAFILSYKTEANLKHLMPEFLSGVFSKNHLFSTNS